MVINRRVEHDERWLKHKAKGAPPVSPIGSHVTDHVAMDRSNSVGMTADAQDLGAGQAALVSVAPGLAAAQQRHGVIRPLTAHVEK
jgi:hypothetical protein